MENDQSTFTKEYGYLIDEFDELQDLRWSDLQYLDEYRELKMKKNDGQPIDQNRLDQLEPVFKNKIVTSARWNKFQNALLGMQRFIKDEVEGYVDDFQAHVDIKTTEVNQYVDTKKIEMDTYADTKKQEVQVEIDKFHHRGTYHPDILYFQKNMVDFDDGTGLQTYIAIKDPPKGTVPTNFTYWNKLTIKGLQGEKGFDGIGLKFVGEWDDTTVYNKDFGVQFGGMLFASLIDDNVGNIPDLTQDTAYWAKAVGVAITVKRMIGVRNIVTPTDTVNFITGEIKSFNKDIDTVGVYKNSTRLTKDVDYVLGSDNQTIKNIKGVWDASLTNPMLFEFEVFKNVLNDLVFSDGSSIQNGTISRPKLTTDVQDDLAKLDNVNADMAELKQLRISKGDSPPTDTIYWLDTSIV